jgi:hypothetical protein
MPDEVVVAPAPVLDVAPAVAPVVVPAPVLDAPVVAPAPVLEPHPADVPSLLEGIGKEAPKPTEVPAPAEVKVEAAPPAEVKAEPVVAPPAPVVPEKIEWKFDLPPTMQSDEPRMSQFTGILDELVTPKEGETRVQVAQRLINLHNDALQEYAKVADQANQRAFNEMRAGWKKDILSDPRIGGAGHKTAAAAIARMRDLSISDHAPGTPGYQKDAAEMEQFLRITGAGDHPAYWKQLHRFARYFDEPAPPPPNPQPPKDIGRNPNQRGLYAKRSN